MFRDALLAVHIAAGVIVLLAACIAVFSKSRASAHRLHVISGTAFTLGMGVIFVTSMPLAILGSSLFLGMIGIFSGYLALSGWRYARNRSGIPVITDWLAVGLMMAVGVGMMIFGGFLLTQGQNMGIVMLVFGGIAVFLANTDLQIFRNNAAKGKERIVQHLTMMLSGTIAALTAFSANVLSRVLPDDLGFVAWLWPTLLITPLIIHWGRRVRANLIGLT